MIRYFLTFCLVLCSITLYGQTQAQAKALYEAGKYDEAKVALQKFVKQQPGNGNYALWYGVSCLKTGDTQLAVKYLETAVKKRIPSGQLYLGQAYNQAFRFQDAIDVLETYKSDLIKRKRSTAEADSVLATSKAGLRQIRGVERVTVIDSMVVDRPSFLAHYKLSVESGTVTANNTYSPAAGLEGGTVYISEMGNTAYYTGKNDSLLNIFRAVTLADGSIQRTALSEQINGGQNANYPFVMPDGNTIYYAADGPESMGGYDIFVTRYNSETDTYYQPENVGMPFNSSANDYMFAIDEFNQLGWFASDRYQPEDKVCIYIFIPNSTKQVYDYESMDSNELIALAQLRSIKDTWTDEEAVNQARERLVEALNTKVIVAPKRDFEFVVDDDHTYYTLNDFKSAGAKRVFTEYQQKWRNYDQQCQRLDDLRNQFASASTRAQESLRPSILDLEGQMDSLREEVAQVAQRVRELEQTTYK